MLTPNLYVVSVPIGNLKDITIRGKETLSEVDFIVAEDTREVGQLLKLLEIPRKELISYRDQTHERVFPVVLNLIRSGKSVALVSDRGTPAISDPGFKLIRDLQAEGVQAIPVPGTSSVLTALVVSGLPTDRFTFLGFLPRKSGEQKRLIEKFIDLNTTLVIFESPFRIVKTLETISEISKEIEASLGHEVTKTYEEIVRGNISEVIEKMKNRKIKGEWIIMLRFS